MNKNTTTTFTPEYNYRIDRREYFSDAGIDEQTSLIQYQNAIAAGNYSLASTIANEAASLNYGAWVFERFANRIIAVENYAINLANLKPKLTAYQNTEPNISDYEDNFAWISSS